MLRMPQKLFVCLALAALTLAVYAQTRHFEFVNYDDPANLAAQAEVLHGLSPEGVQWAFTTTFVGNWIPVTGLTYLLDYSIHGLDPGGYHLTNTAFHCANAVLLFLVLAALTGATWPSALAAALFAAHPQHVESVAWISERKDVVSTFFGLAATGLYGRYASTQRRSAYAAVCLLFTLSLLSKSMLVTLPFVLLLLDVWPLRRAQLAREDAPQWRSLVIEKLPFIAIAAAVSAVTVAVQRASGAMPPGDLLSLPVRAANAVVSYVKYLALTVWPRGLIPYYVHPQDTIPLWHIAGAVLLIAAVTALAWRLRHRRPHLLVGWLWYLGTLVPVIGLVQVGGQAMADRYTYVPHIGLFVAAAWALAGLAVRSQSLRIGVAALSIAAVGALTTLAHQQTAHWRSSIALFEYTLAVDPDNPVALGNLGDAYLAAGRYQDAVNTIGVALQRNPRDAGNLRNLGAALRKLGDLADAERYIRRSLEIDPLSPHSHNHLALILTDQGREREAEDALNAALEVDPEFLDARVNIGNMHLRRGELDRAAEQYRYVLERRPRDAGALSNLGTVDLLNATYPDAIAHFRAALAIAPRDAITRTNLAIALQAAGNIEEARAEAEQALRDDPDYAKAKGLIGDLEGFLPAPDR